MSDFISRTGRVQNWIDDPDGRLPVSCTVFNVQDSMEDLMESRPAGDLRAMLCVWEREGNPPIGT